MAKGERNLLPGTETVPTGSGGGRRADRVIQRVVSNDPAVAGYLKRMVASNCPGCGQAQQTPRGEPLLCARCQTDSATVDRPSVPMGTGEKRVPPASKGRDLKELGKGDARRRRK